MKRTTNLASHRRRRRMFTVLWSALLGIAIISLIYWEMTALLYILATLGVTAVLVVVALSDLSKYENISSGSPRNDDSAAIGSGITSTMGK
jgi:uncharacterized membrane protein YhaH (DUF805 family)